MDIKFINIQFINIDICSLINMSIHEFARFFCNSSFPSFLSPVSFLFQYKSLYYAHLWFEPMQLYLRWHWCKLQTLVVMWQKISFCLTFFLSLMQLSESFILQHSLPFLLHICILSYCHILFSCVIYDTPTRCFEFLQF